MTKEEVNALFKDCGYRKVSNEKLNDAMQQLTNDTTIDNNTVVRTLVISSIINERHYKKVERLNFFLTVVIIILTALPVLPMVAKFTSAITCK